jgi:transcriptional regulator with XRE-family HTH domain
VKNPKQKAPSKKIVSKETIKISYNLKLLRMRNNYTQSYLAQELGKNDYTGYQRLEHGKSDLSYIDGYFLSKIYKIPMEQLLDLPTQSYERNDNEVSKAHESDRPKYLTNSSPNSDVLLTVKLDGTIDNLIRQIRLLENINSILLKTN